MFPKIAGFAGPSRISTKTSSTICPSRLLAMFDVGAKPALKALASCHDQRRYAPLSALESYSGVFSRASGTGR
jgi:hypothetical protein